MGERDLDRDERKLLDSFYKMAKSNHQDIAVLDVRDLSELWLAKKRRQGMADTQAREALKSKLLEWSLGSMWERVQPGAKFAASYSAAALDVALLRKLAVDLGRSGSIFTKYRIQSYGGQAYIIIKGYPGLRSTLNASRYLVTNTKVVEMGLGKLGATRSIVGGLHITMFLTVGFRAIDTLLREEATWVDFVGGLAGDLVKVSIAGAAAFAAASFVAGGAAVAAVAIGPLFAAIMVGVAVGVALEEVDEALGFTAAIIGSLRESDKAMRDRVRGLSREWSWYHRSPEASVNFWMRAFGATY